MYLYIQVPIDEDTKALNKKRLTNMPNPTASTLQCWDLIPGFIATMT